MYKLTMMATLVLSLITTFLPATSCAEISLDNARSQKLVEEMPTGYIKAASGLPREKATAIEAFVKKINAERTKAYQEAAAADPEKKATVESVAAKAAKKIQEKLNH